MNKKVTFILLSSILCTPATHCMDTVKAFGGKIAQSVDGLIIKRPYAFAITSALAGTVAADALTGSALLHGTKRAAKATYTGLVIAKDGIKSGAGKAYDALRHPVATAKATRSFVVDGVKRPIVNPGKATTVGISALGLGTEVYKGFPVSRAMGRGAKVVIKGIQKTPKAVKAVFDVIKYPFTGAGRDNIATAATYTWDGIKSLTEGIRFGAIYKYPRASKTLGIGAVLSAIGFTGYKAYKAFKARKAKTPAPVSQNVNSSN